MKEYIVHEPKDLPLAVEKYTTFFGEPIIELIRCKDCKYFYGEPVNTNEGKGYLLNI